MHPRFHIIISPFLFATKYADTNCDVFDENYSDNSVKYPEMSVNAAGNENAENLNCWPNLEKRKRYLEDIDLLFPNFVSQQHPRLPAFSLNPRSY